MENRLYSVAELLDLIEKSMIEKMPIVGRKVYRFEDGSEEVVSSDDWLKSRSHQHALMLLSQLCGEKNIRLRDAFGMEVFKFDMEGVRHRLLNSKDAAQFLEACGIDAGSPPATPKPEPRQDGRETGTREKQIQALEATARALDYDPLDIPDGGKAAIRAHCLKHHAGLFTESGFDHAWKAAQGRISIRGKERYLAR